MPGTLLALLLFSGPASADQSIPTTEPLLTHEALEWYWQNSLSGGPGKDGIPSIDDPRFTGPGAADNWLDDEDKVIGLYHNGVARAYPQPLLVWHEIVNGSVGGDKVAITYCPLTGTGVGFRRGETELGVSGRLINSNLLMYDRDSDSYWPQILGAGVAGPHRGDGLQEIRVIWTTWGNWKSVHPETEVLSRRTGFARNYRRDPYGSYNPREEYYAEDSKPLFPMPHTSRRYPPKHEIFGFRTASEAVAVDRNALAAAGELRYTGVDGDFLVLHDPRLDTAWVYRAESGELPDREATSNLRFAPGGPEGDALEGLQPVNGFEAFWFAWYAFYPETVVLDDSQ